MAVLRTGAAGHSTSISTGIATTPQVSVAFPLKMAISQTKARMTIIPFEWDVLLTDSTILSDAVVKGMGLGKVDSITLTDAFVSAVIGHSILLFDLITLSDSPIKLFGANKSDSITLSDAVAKLFSKPTIDNLTLTDSPSKLIGPNLSDVISMIDSSLSKSVGMGKDDLISLSDVPFKLMLKPMGDNITLLDALGKGFSQMVLGDIVTLSDGLTKGMIMTLDDSILLGDTVIGFLSGVQVIPPLGSSGGMWLRTLMGVGQ